MSWLRPVLQSSIGSKQMMAVTGTLLSLFVLQHLAGNLLVFAGPDAINAYAAAMQSMRGVVWAGRIGLLLLLIMHVGFAVRLAILNRRARPIRYAAEKDVQLTMASKHMVLTGAVLFVFITYHIAHFTLHIVNNTGYYLDSVGRHDVYHMVVSGFQNPYVSGFYIISMILLGMHLSHGVSSVFQTFGINNSKYNLMIRRLGLFYGWGVALGNISMPAAVYLGFITLPVSGG